MQYFSWIVILIMVNICCFLFFIYGYRKTIQKNATLLDSKIEQLEKLLDNADQMVNELNQLSDYVAFRIEESNEKLIQTLANLDVKIESGAELDNNLNKKLMQHKDLLAEFTQTYEQLENLPLPGENNSKVENDCLASHAENASKQYTLHPKYIEALEMAQSGTDIREISRKLNLGQGEVQLLLETKNGRNIY
ncbi:MAG: hypothetical protein PWQ70_171 [Clostridiales bacterium]|nr:hypothetical protein [Clostridiales bacterium]